MREPKPQIKRIGSHISLVIYLLIPFGTTNLKKVNTFGNSLRSGIYLLQRINLIRLIVFRFPSAAIYFRCNAEFNRGPSSDNFLVFAVARRAKTLRLVRTCVRCLDEGLSRGAGRSSLRACVVIVVVGAEAPLTTAGLDEKPTVERLFPTGANALAPLSNSV